MRLKAPRTLWIVKQYAVSPDQAGGTRQFDFARELAKRGWEVVLWASSFSYLEHRDTKLRPGERWRVEPFGDVRVVWLKSFPYRRNDWRRVVNIVHFAWVLHRWGVQLVRAGVVPAPDVVWAFSVPLLAPWVAQRLAARYRAAFVLEVGDLWPQTLIDMGVLGERHPLTALLRAIERTLCQGARRLLVGLPHADAYLRRLGVPPERLVPLPHGVDVRRFQTQEPSTPSSNDAFTLLYVGAHGPANALDTLLKAAKRLQAQGHSDDVRIVLVGDGQEKPRLQALAREWALKNVEFRDPVPRRLVPELLQQADALVLTLRDLPLYRYGINLNKLFDYMAAGKPVLFAGHSRNNPVEAARCGLTVPPENPQALADAILQLKALSPESRAAMGRRGRRYVQENHALDRLVDRLERALEAAYEEHRGGLKPREPSA